MTQESPETTKPETEAKPEPTLDDLLAEFKDPQEKAPEVAKPEPAKADGELEDLKKFRNEYRQDRIRRDISETVSTIRDSHKSELGWMKDDWIEGRLDSAARKDPRIAQAFLDRERNPDTWARVRQKLGEQLAEEIKSRPDPQLTEDRDAARAAVRGQTATLPSETIDPRKFNSMSERELEEYVKARRKA